MLEEVRGAVGLLRLEPRPGVDPDAHSRGLGGEGGLRGDAEAVGEGRHAGLGRAQDPRVVRQRGHRGPVFQEAWVRVIEPAEFGFGRLREAVVEHGVGRGRGRRGGGLGGRRKGGEEAEGG